AIRRVGGDRRGDLALPAFAVRQKLFLVVHQLLAGLGGELEIRAFDDRIDRAGFLAEAAIDAFGHVDVIARGAAAAVLAGLGFDGDDERVANRFAKVAGDATFFAIGIAAQGMLTPETRAQPSLFKGIVERRLGAEEIFQRQPHGRDELGQEKGSDSAIEYSHRHYPLVGSRSKARRTPAVSTTQTSDSGRNTFQPRRMSWS